MVGSGHSSLAHKACASWLKVQHNASRSFRAAAMTAEIEDSVVFSDGRSSVALTPAGAPSLGFPTKIDLVAGPFRGSIVDDTIGYEQFYRELVDLYKSLSGTARLSSYEHFSLKLTASRTGSIWIRVVSFGNHCPMVKLEYEFGFDQTYLPPIIKSIERLFLNQREKGIEQP
jgi:hypothetical protein